MIEKLPGSMHFIGIAGIGMSGVAQAAASLGVRVTGSDRAISAPENSRILDSLRAQGIVLYNQDGSVYHDYQPDVLVYSTAIEEDNPDYREGVHRLHRSEAVTLLVEAMRGTKLHAVAGTCGKTTVSGWLTEALSHLGADPVSLCGGLMNAFSDGKYCGNFRAGQGDSFVLEADESDKSLLNYTPDSAILLNIGEDHYERSEVADVFARFLDRVNGPCVVEDKAFFEIGADRLRGKNIVLISGDPSSPDKIFGFPVYKLSSICTSTCGFRCQFADHGEEFSLPVPGVHSAVNALAVYALLVSLGYGKAESLKAVQGFSGVWRRFDYAGEMQSGVKVYDDYAHNPDKICSAIRTAQTVAQGAVHVVFQPHGFKPLRMMREELFEVLERTLRTGDTFGFLPVFYAGGTTSFEPKSEDVVSGYNEQGENGHSYRYYSDRDEAEKMLKNTIKGGDLVLILGARDNSLSIWAKKIGFSA